MKRERRSARGISGAVRLTFSQPGPLLRRALLGLCCLSVPDESSDTSGETALGRGSIGRTQRLSKAPETCLVQVVMIG
jgi:hypothetical protein